MPRNESTPTKRLTANDVYELTRDVLQEHLELDMSSSEYEASDIWDVLVTAAVQQPTVETACGLLERAPSANTVRTAVKALLMDDEQLVKLEATVNAMLVARLPKNLLKRARPCAVDFTDLPYHGQHDADDEHIRRGRAKSGTTHFHSFTTLCVVKANRRYTLALSLHRRSDTVLDALKRVLDTARTTGLRIRRLLLDREFDNNAVVGYLFEQPFPTIMPLMIRGKKGGARRVLQGRKSHTTTYTRHSVQYGTHVLPITVVCRYKKGRFGDHGVQRVVRLDGAQPVDPLPRFESRQASGALVVFDDQQRGVLANQQAAHPLDGQGFGAFDVELDQPRRRSAQCFVEAQCGYLGGLGARVVGMDLCECSPGPKGDPYGQGWDAIVGARLLYRMVGFAQGSD